MSSVTNQNRPEADEITELQRQLHRYSNGIEEFEAMAAELKSRPMDARVADMIRLNRETIQAMRRSAQLIEERMRQAEMRARISH